jgi:hypothetical protein
MDYNHITYGQQKAISPKKTEATPSCIGSNFITREFLSAGIVIRLFIAQGICLMQGIGCQVSEEDSAW